jgi:acetyl-CoA C-acetyltransferase
MSEPVFVLGGWQSDFADKAEAGLYPLIEAATLGALADAGIDPGDIDVAHVGNAGGEVFCAQAHLGGMVATVDPAFASMPAARHEAACASGSIAVLAAMADIESGRYDVALVVGVDILRNVPGIEAGKKLAIHLWADREAVGAEFPWPCQFGEVSTEYDRRYGVDHVHLERIARRAFTNARRNPLAQTRDWDVADEWFAPDDAKNPIVHGILRRHEFCRITDGSAAVVLASQRYARDYATRRGRDVALLPRIKGWGHRTAPMLLATKLERSKDERYVFPHVHQTALDALNRAKLSAPTALGAIELHDCTTIGEYVLLDHLGLSEPGKIWQLMDDGYFELDGTVPVNPSGGLIGAGHPIGATGVRMMNDAVKQVTRRAGETQIDGVNDVMTFNVGGSYTTVACFVVGI